MKSDIIYHSLQVPSDLLTVFLRDMAQTWEPLQSRPLVTPFNSLFLLSANMGSSGVLGNTVNVLEEKIISLQKARLQVSVVGTVGLLRRWWLGLS